MIDRGADDGEADGDVDPPFEADQLQRDMSLIVVHGDHSIEFAALEAVEERIGRVGAACLEPLGLRGLNCRRDFIDLFAAEQAALSGMGVQPGDSDPLFPRSQIAQRLMRQSDGRQDPPPFHFLAGAAKRRMGRDMDDPHSTDHKHHRVVLGTGPLGE